MQLRPNEKNIFIPGPVGQLEAVHTSPAPDNQQWLAVVCHPHPLFGGTMFNKVVTTVTHALSDLGMPVIRFNFRGVGASDGQYAEASGETDDLLAIVAYAQQLYPQRNLCVAGFSFGAYIAIRASQQISLQKLITIAPAVTHFPAEQFISIKCPWLLIQGEQDEVVDPKRVFEWVEQQQFPPHLVRFPETGHFFHRKLTELRETILQERF